MVQQINSLAEYSLFNKNDDVIPEWLVSKFNTASVSTATLYYIETDHQQILTKERELVEFLSRKCGTRLESKLQRITCYVAFRMREEEHEKMLQRREKGWQSSEQNTVKSILDVPDGKIVEFDASHSNLRREMAYESWHMQHCVGQFDDRKILPVVMVSIMQIKLSNINYGYSVCVIIIIFLMLLLLSMLLVIHLKLIK